MSTSACNFSHTSGALHASQTQACTNLLQNTYFYTHTHILLYMHICIHLHLNISKVGPCVYVPIFKYISNQEVAFLSSTWLGFFFLAYPESFMCQISYVLDTEDLFFRVKRRRCSSSSHDRARIERFHRFLTAS